MITKYLRFTRNRWFIAVAFLLLGAAIVLAIRFASYKVDAVHYHANFALYINGQREEFKAASYYTEIEMCTLDDSMVPSERAHMHDNVNDVVHVEDHAVTWGQFFTNLGWTIGPTTIISRDGTVYTETGDSKLNLLLDGQNYTDLNGVQNRVIQDKDKLLISFGNVDEKSLDKQYASIPSTAGKYDQAQDPASCSGNHQTTVHDRLTHLL